MTKGPAHAKEVNFMCHYATEDELDFMYTLAGKLSRDAQVVMLGAGPGVLLLALKDRKPDLTTIVVDIVRCDYTLAYLREGGYAQNVSTFTMDSVRFGEENPELEIDLLIVDTDHTELTTRREIEAFLPLVKRDGYIFFHDYDATGTWFEDQEQYPGVKEAVDDLMTPYERTNRVGTAVVYRKREPGTK